ncbi:MAG: methyl-accepting chemotaxis protein [Gammaproteobacteria bacterium]|nr:methyl-accepting chemotaxis protein [Gammaproteobacteria bacterium]
MNFNKLSIKQLLTFLLLSLGTVVILLFVIATLQLRDTALESQTRSLSRIIEVGVSKSMEELDSLMNDLGVYTTKTGDFRSIAERSIDDPADHALIGELAKLLDDQYHQRYVTSSIVDLQKIRIFNLDFKLVAQSNEGDRSLAPRLPDSLLTKARVREGADRLKMLTSLWMDNGEAFYSALLPLGGLRQIGYMEIVVKSAHNLKNIEHIVKLPITIVSADGDRIYQSDSWGSAERAKSLPIEYELKTENGDVALRFTLLEDMKHFQEGMNDTQLTSIGGFAVILVIFLIAALRVLNRHLFNPVTQLVGAIEKCAGGDLTIEIDSKGLKDLHTLSEAFSVLVENLRTQVSVISKDAENLAVSAQNLSATIESTQEALQYQRNETDLVATSINEMSASSMEVSRNAERVAIAASDAKREALNGQQVVGQTVDSISKLAGEVQLASEVMNNLKGESVNIGTVLDVIRGIAEQTNLLALNAAIEAARAGEQGRGFAVVADEVRTLAGRTQQSTQEIQKMIESLQSGTNQAVSVMDRSREMTRESVEFANEAGNYLETITQSIGDISDMTSQIATASEQQSAVVESVNQSIVSITDFANKTSEGAERVTGNSRDLSGMANSLKNLVKHFKVQ